MRNHKGDVRGFYISHRAWYWNAARNIDSEVEAEVMFGLYADDSGGTSGELGMRWRGNAARLESFCDSWSALATFKDVLDALAETDKHTGNGVTVDEFVAILTRLGFKDLTAYTRESK